MFAKCKDDQQENVKDINHKGCQPKVSDLTMRYQCTEHVLFILYTAPLSIVIEKHSILQHSYADHSQLQKSAPPHQIPDLFLSMQKCIDDIKSWMTLNKLKLNVNKTEAMIVSSGQKSRSLSFSFPDFINVGCASVPLSDSCQEPWCDAWLPTDRENPCLQSVHWYAQLPLNSVALVPSVIFCPQMPQRLSSLPLFFHVFDYCNSLLFGCPQHS